MKNERLNDHTHQSVDPVMTIDDKISIELVNLLYTQSRETIPGALIAGTAIVYCLRDFFTFSVLAWWYFSVLFVSVLRLTSYSVFMHRCQHNSMLKHIKLWRTIFAAITIAGGINWMIVGSFLLSANPYNQMIIAFAIGAIASGSTSIFAPSKPIASIFLFQVLIPFGLTMLILGNQVQKVIGIITFLYLVILLINVTRIHSRIYARLKLKLEKDDLIESISATKSIIESVNNELRSEVSERKEIEKKLRNSEDQYRLVTDALPVLIAYIDPALRFSFNNKAYESWFNKPLSEITGKPLKEILSEPEYQTFKQHYNQVLHGKRDTYETSIFFHDQQERYVSVTLIPHLHEKTIIGTFSLISDMTPRINYLATHDSLTNLPNRRLFDVKLNHAIKHAETHGSKVAILFLDLDHFKNVNDTLGHDIGDQLLVKVVGRLKECVQEGDTIARLGGDEFIILLQLGTRIERATEVAKNLCDALADVFKLADRELFITTSIGISLYPDDGNDMHLLLKNADLAMYRAKERGRNTFEYYTRHMDEVIQKKIKIETKLRGAIEREELELYYQPIINMKKNRIDGVEALIRWNHPEMGFISPAEFIPIAEESDLIMPIGEWVLRTACNQIVYWHNGGYKQLHICVNLSARQFLKNDLVKVIARILEETGIDGKFLTLEITESFVMTDLSYSYKIIKALKELDITISLDDFGTGYSSLTYLKRFPFDVIKIDQSFISDFTIHPEDAAIVKAIITLSHNLKMKVVAEGVEKPEQYLFLKEQGCDEAQGYLFYPPLPEMDLTTVLTAPQPLAFSV